MVVVVNFFLIIIALLPASAGAADCRFLGKVSIPADARDASGERGELEGGIPADRLGSLGSGIAWTGRGNRYAMISDRGPADGATAYRCRFHIVDIQVNESASPAVTYRLLQTHLLTDRQGRKLIGSLNAFPEASDPRGVRYDPEAIRVTPKGTLLISDEYGPSINEFSADGREIAQLPVPSRYSIAKPSAKPEDELPPHNVAGRQPNRGLEGLALSADGETVYSLIQNPLIQDGAMDEANKKIGTNLRLLQINRKTGKTSEYVYQLEAPTNGCNEIESIAPGRFLVIERDGKPGTEGAVKLIFEIDIRQATDISRLESLPSQGTPAGIKAVSKRLLVNLLDPSLNLIGPDFPEKIEGLAIGPKLEDGSRLLLITSDNDFVPTQPSWIYAFAIRTE